LDREKRIIWLFEEPRRTNIRWVFVEGGRHLIYEKKDDEGKRKSRTGKDPAEGSRSFQANPSITKRINKADEKKNAAERKKNQ